MGFLFGSKDTTTTNKVELDPDLKAAALQNLDIGNEVGAIGMPMYRGPSVAGFSPQQLAGMQGVDQTAAAFGMPSAVNWQQQQNGSFSAPQGMDQAAMYTALTGMAPPDSTAGGHSGYSFMPMFEDALARTPAAQRAAVESFFMNPHTGAAPTNASVPAPKTKFSGGKVVGSRKSDKGGDTLEDRLRKLKTNEYGHSYRSGSDR